MNEQEKFKALAVDLEPAVMQMEEALRKHKIAGTLSLGMVADGYFNLSVVGCKWNMIRDVENESKGFCIEGNVKEKLHNDE